MKQSDEVHFQSGGDSLPVPNVQALSDSLRGSSQIPERYIMKNDRPELIVCRDVELPVINLARLEDPEFYRGEAAKLDLACKEWGFFQLVNHGISEELITQLKADVTEFFNLPLEEKMAYQQKPGGLQGYGQAFVQSNEQKLDWADMLYLMTRPISVRNLNFWPNSPSSFRGTVDQYSLELGRVAKCLFQNIAKNLGVAPEKFIELFKDQPQGLRFNYYPSCTKADEVIGLSPHSDTGGLTLLIQINDIQGLQIKKDREWITVNALPGALIVNVGDILEILSNGICKSIEHRATINAEHARMSIAAFHGPDQNITLQPLPEIVGVGKTNFKTVSYEEFMKMFFAAKLDGKSQLDRMRV